MGSPVLKRGHDGVYHHMSVKHLQRYVNEFTFRMNEADCETDTIDRIRALCAAMAGKCIKWREVTA